MQVIKWKIDFKLQHLTMKTIQTFDVKFKALQKKNLLATMQEI